MAANKEEWGIKYQDEVFKFQKEWDAINERITRDENQYIDSDLGLIQKKKVEMIADKVLDLNMMELQYFYAKVARNIQKNTGMSHMKMNLDWASMEKDGTGIFPSANPNYFKQ